MHRANFITHLALRTFYGSSGHKSQREIPTPGLSLKGPGQPAPPFPVPVSRVAARASPFPHLPLGKPALTVGPHPAAVPTMLYSLSVALVFLWHRGSRCPPTSVRLGRLPLSTVADRRHGVGAGHANSCPQAPGAGGTHTASRGEMAPKAVSGTGSPGCTGRGSWVAKSKGPGAARPGLRPMPPAV